MDLLDERVEQGAPLGFGHSGLNHKSGYHAIREMFQTRLHGLQGAGAAIPRFHHRTKRAHHDSLKPAGMMFINGEEVGVE